MNTPKLIAAYSQFMHHLHETMEETLDSFTDAFETSKEKTRESSDLTHEELEQVSGHVKRDIEHAAKI
jgi:hypothetical protein